MTFPNMREAATERTVNGSQKLGSDNAKTYSNADKTTQAYTHWLSQTTYWRDSLAARLADARSRVVIGLHVNELHSIQREVAEFKSHCADRPSFDGGAA